MAIKISIQAKIYFLVGVVMASFLIGLISIGINARTQYIQARIQEQVLFVEQKFLAMEKGDINMMSATLEAILQRSDIVNLLAKKDKNALLKSEESFFKKIKENFGITHYYFIDNNGNIILRVHRPEQFGDKVERITFKEAVASQKMGSGLELGKTAFALRVVKPAKVGTTTIGYIELGQEITHFLHSLQIKRNDDFVLLVDKKDIDREGWKTLRQNNKLPDNWDDFSDYLAVESTVDDVLAAQILQSCFKPEIFKKIHEAGESQILGEYRNKEQVFSCGSFPVHDASGKDVGIVIAIKDITDIDSGARLIAIQALMVYLLLVSLLVLALLILSRMVIVSPLKAISRAVKKIASGAFSVSPKIANNDEFGDLSESIRIMAGNLQDAYLTLEEKVQERTKSLSEKSQKLEATKKAMVNLLQDIEEEKEAVSQERARYESLLSSIGDGVLATDSSGKTIYANEVALSTLNISRKQALGKDIAKIVSLRDKKKTEVPIAQRPINLAITQKQFVSFSGYYVLKSGNSIPVSITTSPIIHDNELLGAIEVFRDISQELAVDKAKTEFVSLASHQLRTPLSAINWYSEMLLAGDAGKLKSEQQHYVKEIFDGNQRMIDLVNALLNVSRIELGTFAISPEQVDVVEIAKSMVHELEAQIKAKKLEVVEEYVPGLPQILADKKITRILVQNLLTNSVKYTPEGGRVVLSLSKDDKNFIIKVADNGYGIPDADKPKIFDKLYRAQNVREKETDGTGLGLYLVKQIVEQAGGKVWFESEENKGTTFYINIPLSGMMKKEGSKQLS